MAHFWEFLDQFLHDAVKADGKKHWRQWIPLLNTGCAAEFTAVPKDGWVFFLGAAFFVVVDKTFQQNRQHPIFAEAGYNRGIA